MRCINCGSYWPLGELLAKRLQTTLVCLHTVHSRGWRHCFRLSICLSKFCERGILRGNFFKLHTEHAWTQGCSDKLLAVKGHSNFTKHVVGHNQNFSHKTSDRIKWWSNVILYPKGQRSTPQWHPYVLQNHFSGHYSAPYLSERRALPYSTFGRILNWWHWSWVSTFKRCWLWRSSVLLGWRCLWNINISQGFF